MTNADQRGGARIPLARTQEIAQLGRVRALDLAGDALLEAAVGGDERFRIRGQRRPAPTRAPDLGTHEIAVEVRLELLDFAPGAAVAQPQLRGRVRERPRLADEFEQAHTVVRHHELAVRFEPQLLAGRGRRDHRRASLARLHAASRTERGEASYGTPTTPPAALSCGMALPDDLTDDEQRLVAAAEAGEDCDLARERPEADDAAAPTVRAEVVRAIVTGDGTTGHARGLYLRGARVTGALDLESMTLAAPMVLQACHFEELIILRDARTRRIDLSDCFLPGMSAPYLRVDGELSYAGSSVEGPMDLYASGMDRLVLNGLSADGEITLLEADVRGELSAQAAKLRSPGGRALSADRMKVEGSVFLADGFEADGEVRLLGVEIGRDLDSNGAKLRNAGGDALTADGMHVKGDVFLQGDFEADGEVGLRGAEIGGDLSCRGAKLRNPGRRALAADRMTVNGGVFFQDGFEADGEVRLLGAEIGGQLACVGAKLRNPGGAALTAGEMTVGGGVFLRGDFEADGLVRFPAAEVLGQFEITGTLSGQSRALDLQGASVAGELRITPTAKPSGIVDLRHAHASVLRDDPRTWPGSGRLMLDGFRYDRIHDEATASAEERVDWLSLMPANPAGTPHTQPYEHLAAVYDSMGRTDDAKTIRAAKERAVRSKRSWRGKLWSRLLDWTVLYGLKPERAIYIGVAVMLLGWGLFAGAEVLDLMETTVAATDPAPTPLTWLTAGVFSADAFLPVVDLGLESEWQPDAAGWGWFFQGYLWLHIVLGWGLSTLAVFAFTGIVRSK